MEAPPVPVAPVSAAEAALQGPVFDIILSSPLAPQSDLIEPERTWIEPSVRRYLLCGSVVLAGVLIGAWLYGEKKDAGALAVVAAQVNAQPQIGKVVKRPAMGVKEFTLGTDGEVRVASVVPATSPSVPPHAVPVVPPLVLLEPKKVAELVPAASAAPLPKRVRRVERAQVIAAPAKVERAKVAREKVAREKVERAKVDRAPERPVAREAEPGSAFAMKATLEACKNHGYQPAQCVKQACSVGKYGFVCRGK
ncbi:hypothetical protein [Massilia sp. TWP1-3-3]|uniref:hypothetical protein n=1 Tax=Massilia sp. TWP1-3-3 TaxID=2804573 RepID=UPI003CEF04A2